MFYRDENGLNLRRDNLVLKPYAPRPYPQQSPRGEIAAGGRGDFFRIQGGQVKTAVRAFTCAAASCSKTDSGCGRSESESGFSLLIVTAMLRSRGYANAREAQRDHGGCANAEHGAGNCCTASSFSLGIPVSASRGAASGQAGHRISGAEEGCICAWVFLARPFLPKGPTPEVAAAILVAKNCSQRRAGCAECSGSSSRRLEGAGDLAVRIEGDGEAVFHAAAVSWSKRIVHTTMMQ